MRSLIDLVISSASSGQPSTAPTLPSKSTTPKEQRVGELRVIAARYRDIGAFDMAAEYDAQADQLRDSIEPALFIHHVVEGLPLPSGAWRRAGC